MKERPILFSASMVRAILNGSKTQTRRVIKPQPWEEYSAESIKCEHYAPCIVDKYGEMDAGPEIFGAYSTDGEWGVRCPYGHPGDKLWVRETWNKHGGLLIYHADGDWVAEYKSKHDKTNLTAVYEAKMLKWNPSNNMPRWAPVS